MKDNEIVVDVHADRPTLRQLLAIGKTIGRDRFSLLREASPEHEAGLVVVLFSRAAIRDCGPMLLEFARDLGDQDKEQVLHIDPDTDLTWVPKWLDETKQRWANVDLGGTGMLVAFTGNWLCGRIAKELTVRGCPT